mgnify:CR=1 FL=1
MLRLDGFQRLALLTTGTTYLLIMVGGVVRASGAGLGCPDWPLCFGLLVPPTSAGELPPGFDPTQFNALKTWTEYLNRLLGALVGLLILATTIGAIVQHRGRPRVWLPTVGALVLVGVTGWLGGRVVKTGLDPLTLTAHLVFALGVVSLLLYATLSAFFPAGPLPRVEPALARTGRLTVLAGALVLVQVGLGAFVRGAVQEVADQGVPRAEWLAHVGAVEAIHGSFAVLVTGAVLGVAYLAARPGDPWLRRAGRAAAAAALVQAGAGWGLTALGFPRVLQVVHLTFAALLIGALSLVALLAFRVDPRAAPRP